MSVWFCPHRCRLRTFVRELVTAPKLRIGPHRVAVVLTTRVTGDLRLLRILAIDPARPRVAQQNREIGGAGWHLGRGEFLSKRRGVVQRGIASRPRRRDAQRARLAHSRALMVGRHDTGAESKARLRFREGRAWCAVVLSHASRPIRHASLLVQPAKHALVGYPIKRVPEAPIRGVEDDGPARAQMTPPVRVGTDEHVHQAAVDPANLRRQTPRIGVSGSPWVRRPSWSAGQPVSELLSAGWWW